MLDANRCLSWSTQRPARSRRSTVRAIGDAVYGCDICQDVCPWNRGVEKRRAGEPPPASATVDLVAWLEADGADLLDRYDAALRPAPRSALPEAERARRARQHRRTGARRRDRAVPRRRRPAAARARGMGARAAARAAAGQDDAMTGAVDRFRGLERWIAWLRLGAVPFALFQVAVAHYQPGYRALGLAAHRRLRRRCARALPLSRRDLDDRGAGAARRSPRSPSTRRSSPPSRSSSRTRPGRRRASCSSSPSSRRPCATASSARPRSRSRSLPVARRVRDPARPPLRAAHVPLRLRDVPARHRGASSG